jgi:hypothetical protein
MNSNAFRKATLVLSLCGALSPAARADTPVFDISDTLTGASLQSKIYEFFIPTAGAYSGTLTDQGSSPPTFELLALGIAKTPNVVGGTVGPGTFSFNADSAGTYTAYLFGKPVSDLGGSFGISISAVPQVETWVMLLVGMGLVAYQLRRRNRAQTALVPI